MTSPDLPAPVTLTLHAVNENDLVDAAIAAFHVNVPEWVEQEGATEVVLIEALALLMGQQIFALNQLPRVVLDGIIAIRGQVRKAAVPASGVLGVVLAASTLGTRTLPKGARFRVRLESGATFDVLAAEDTVMNPADGLNEVVNVVAEVPGTEPNGTAPGTEAVMVDAYTWVESAVVSTIISGGGDIEPDTAFYPRVAAVFQSQSTTLVTDSQFAVAALGVPGVGRAKGYGLWDGVGAIGTMGGHMTVGVAGPDGANVSAQVKADVLAALQVGAVAGLQIHVIDFAHVTMNLVVTYSLAPGYIAADVSPAIDAALRAWLNPVTWPFPETLTSVNQIILRIGTVAGVDNVTSVTGWSNITGGATLPTVGTITFNVV